MGDLLPLRFTNPAEDKRLAAIQAVDLYDLKLSHAEELTGLPQRSQPAEQELFAAPPAGLIFEDNAGAAALKIASGERKPTFSGEVLVEIVASKDRLRENFIALTPESAGIDRVIVQLSQSGKVPPRWTLASEDDKPLSIRQWSKSEQAGAGLIAGEIWELTLRRPQSTPFKSWHARGGFRRSSTGLSGVAARGRHPARHTDNQRFWRQRTAYRQSPTQTHSTRAGPGG